MVAAASVQYVNVNPEDEPAVTDDAVRSIVEGKQTAPGFVITTVGVIGCAGITASSDKGDVHPKEFVTLKVYVPAGIPDMVVDDPVPVFVTRSG